LNGKQEKCSKCGTDTEVYSRVVGYLRPVRQWNNGKQAEFKMRRTFKVDESALDADEIPQKYRVIDESEEEFVEPRAGAA
jgi:hypothetical protein